MAQLVDVLVEFFRAFGYVASKPGELQGTSGRRHPVPLLLEKDTRRLAVTLWMHREPLGGSYLQEFVDTVNDTGCDGGLIVSIGFVPEKLLAQAGRDRVNVWDARRTCQELGSAVLRETCPGVWQQADPWRAPRQSQILDQVHQTVLGTLTPDPTVPSPGPTPPVPMPGPEDEPPFPAPVAPMLAPPEAAPADTLQLPLAFLDAPVAPPAAAPTGVPTPEPGAPGQAVLTPAPIPSGPTLFTPPPAMAGPVRPSRNVLRVQVNRQLAGSLAKPRTRSVDRLFLRLTPHHVFEYAADLLVEGTVKSEKQTGRIAIDAVSKRTKPWTRPTDCAELAADIGETDERPVRVSEADALRIATAELRSLVTRDVVHEEDDSEWSVVVKKKVELAPDALEVRHLGVFWIPVWRVTGRDGSLEIDAATGEVVHEEISSQKTDALLL